MPTPAALPPSSGPAGHLLPEGEGRAFNVGRKALERGPKGSSHIVSTAKIIVILTQVRTSIDRAPHLSRRGPDLRQDDVGQLLRAGPGPSKSGAPRARHPIHPLPR